jgi:hypothetical protein
MEIRLSIQIPARHLAATKAALQQGNRELTD